MTLCDPIDYSPLGSLVRGGLRARILEWVAISFPKGSSNPGIELESATLAGGLFTTEPPGMPFCKLFSSVTQSCPTLCDPMDFSMPGLPVHQQLPELAQTHVYGVGDTIQPSHPLLSPSPPASNISQHQDLFQWVSSLPQVAKVLEFQLQHQSFQWIFRTNFL